MKPILNRQGGLRIMSKRGRPSPMPRRQRGTSAREAVDGVPWRCSRRRAARSPQSDSDEYMSARMWYGRANSNRIVIVLRSRSSQVLYRRHMYIVVRKTVPTSVTTVRCPQVGTVLSVEYVRCTHAGIPNIGADRALLLLGIGMD